MLEIREGLVLELEPRVFSAYSTHWNCGKEDVIQGKDGYQNEILFIVGEI